MAKDQVKALEERTIQVQVAKRKSIDFNGKMYGPGAKLDLPLSEAKALHGLGFIVEPDDEEDDIDPVTASAPANAGLTIQTGEQDQ